MRSQVLIDFFFLIPLACSSNQHQRGAGGRGDMWKLSLRISGEHRRARPQPRDEPRWRQRQPGEAQSSFRSRAFSLTMRFSPLLQSRLTHKACVTLYSQKKIQQKKTNCFIYITKHSSSWGFLFFFFFVFISISSFSLFNLVLDSFCTVVWDHEICGTVCSWFYFSYFIYRFCTQRGPWWAEKPKEREQIVSTSQWKFPPPPLLYSYFVLHWGHTTWFYFSSYKYI